MSWSLTLFLQHNISGSFTAVFILIMITNMRKIILGIIVYINCQPKTLQK